MNNKGNISPSHKMSQDYRLPEGKRMRKSGGRRVKKYHLFAGMLKGMLLCFSSSRPYWCKHFKQWLLLIDALTWLWTVFSWLLKVMVKLVDVLGATWVMNGVLLWFTVSYIFTRRLQISMFWKQDLTLWGKGGQGRYRKSTNRPTQVTVHHSGPALGLNGRLGTF